MKSCLLVSALLVVISITTNNVAFGTQEVDWAAALFVPEQEMVGLRWTPVEGAEKYRVYRKEKRQKTYQLLTETQIPQYFDKDIKRTEYSYKIIAMLGNVETIESAEKTIQTFYHPGRMVPPKWENISIVEKDNSNRTQFFIKLSWTRINGATAYNIYEVDPTGYPVKRLATTSENIYNDTRIISSDVEVRYGITYLDRSYIESPLSTVRTIILQAIKK
jgi:fibronectin type 3 domain-containing protein